jgi:hypothetical protein
VGQRFATLIELSRSGGTSLMAAWTARAIPWRTSGPFQLANGDRVLSYGATPAGGVFALVARSAGKEELALSTTVATGWRRLPAPPAQTATVAFGPGATIDALAATSTTLTVWRLAGNTRSWRRAQMLHVAIQYGSSS